MILERIGVVTRGMTVVPDAVHAVTVYVTVRGGL